MRKDKPEGWNTPRQRQERRERLATRIRDGSWKLLGGVAALHVVQTMVNYFIPR